MSNPSFERRGPNLKRHAVIAAMQALKRGTKPTEVNFQRRVRMTDAELRKVERIRQLAEKLESADLSPEQRRQSWNCISRGELPPDQLQRLIDPSSPPLETGDPALADAVHNPESDTVDKS